MVFGLGLRAVLFELKKVRKGEGGGIAILGVVFVSGF